MTALFSLVSVLLIVFAPAISSNSAETQTLFGMVYCPLSKKLQPVKPSKEKNRSFKDICAAQETKDFLVQEIFVKNLFKEISPEENALDELAFDFLARGKSAFDGLPNLPNFPSETFIRQINIIAAVNNDHGREYDWNKPAQTFFLPSLAPRPPSGEKSFSQIRRRVFQSDELSRRIAPRAPPLLS